MSLCKDMLKKNMTGIFKQKKSEVKLYYYNYPNVGDLLNVLLPEMLFGVKAVEEGFPKAEMIAVGSILDRLLVNGNVPRKLKEMQKEALQDAPIHVWGTGLMYSYKSGQEFIRPVKIHALRGKKTAEIVYGPGRKKYPCVLGDPGLLASMLVAKEIIPKKYDVGILPHYVDAKEDVIEQMHAYYPNSIVIDVKAEPMEVIREIASCRTVLSTGLHGLIIADSFHIPNLWCECSNRILGEGFKFRDYYSAFDLEAEPLDLRKGNFPAVQEIIHSYRIRPEIVKKKQRQLVRCFPFRSQKARRRRV